jgi:hypothetical protein
MVGRWPYRPGTLRALGGMEDRKYDPCPYRCRDCGRCGELEAKVPEAASYWENRLIAATKRAATTHQLARRAIHR